MWTWSIAAYGSKIEVIKSLNAQECPKLDSGQKMDDETITSFDNAKAEAIATVTKSEENAIVSVSISGNATHHVAKIKKVN